MCKDCTFCQIIDGSISSKIIHQNNLSIAVMSLQKDVPGHILVFPKKHFPNLESIDTASLIDTMSLIKQIGKQIQRLEFTSYNLLSANGRAAGQSISHFHFHFIPRKNNDNLNAWPDFNYKGDINIDKFFNELKS